jgi:CMP-N-acetylneuraminic acid synthetase
MNILVTICARGGSKGVKNKNIRMLNRKPLIAHTIEHALKWGRAKKIIVSTDSEKIARIAKQFGALVPFKRPAKLAGDKTPKVEVLRHALKESERIFRNRFDIIVDLDVTAPIRRLLDIENCYKKFLKIKPLTLFSVVRAHRNPYFNMVEENEAGFVSLSKTLAKKSYRRQDAPSVYDMNASIYFYQRQYLLDKSIRSPISKRSVVYVMDDVSAFDIDREIDFKFIEFLNREGIFKL